MPRLVGPPDIHKPVDVTATAMLQGAATLGFTENNSLTYTATSNPCLDLFFHILPSTPKKEIEKRLKKAWKFNPLTTLKLVCNIRGIRGTGKSDKERFYSAAIWLHKHHPKTLAGNVGVFVEFGYHKDLLEILYRLLEGEDARQKVKREWELKKLQLRMRLCLKRTRRNSKTKLIVNNLPRDFGIASNRAKVEDEKEHARSLRKEKNLAKAKKAYDRYNSDFEYRYLHDCVYVDDSPKS